MTHCGLTAGEPGVYGASVPSPSLAAVVEARRLAASGEAKTIRTQAGLSASEMARAVHVHHKTLIAWEDGTAIPRADAAARWLEQLDSLRQISPPGLVVGSETAGHPVAVRGDRPAIP